MKFSYEPANKNYFATNLRRKEDRLKWDTGNGGMTLVFQGRFGEDITLRMDEICSKLSSLDTSAYHDGFVPLAPEIPFVSVCLLDAKQNAQQKARGGLKIRGDVGRFTVLACRVKDDECTVYAPGKKQTVDIPAEVSITCEKVYDYRSTGLFGRKQVEEFAGYYQFSVDGDRVGSYQDGAICYVVNDINIPVTKAMIDAEHFYIKAQDMPVFRSNNEGYSISVKEIG